MSLYDYIAAVPKADLHVHLEGSIQPSTLLMLAERHRVDLLADSEEGLRNWYRFRDFHHFIEVYVAITKCLRTVEDFELIVYEFGADMARQNIRYARSDLLAEYPPLDQPGRPGRLVHRADRRAPSGKGVLRLRNQLGLRPGAQRLPRAWAVRLYDRGGHRGDGRRGRRPGPGRDGGGIPSRAVRSVVRPGAIRGTAQRPPCR